MRGGQTEDEAEGGVAFPEGSGRQGHGQLKQGDHGEVDGKAQPDDEPRLAEAPDFGNAVVDDVGDGKDRNPAVMVTGPNWRILVSRRFEATRQAQNTTPSSMNERETVAS